MNALFARIGIIACSLAAAGCGTGAVWPRHAILTGAIVNYTKQAGAVTENPIEATKEGESCAHSFAIPFIWLSFAFLNASAKKANTTDRIATVDRANLGILGVYANSCAIVTPEAKPRPLPASPPPPSPRRRRARRARTRSWGRPTRKT